MGNIFTKRGTEDAAPAQAPQPQESPMIDSSKIDTIIGPNSLIKGDLHSKGTLRVDGTIEGKVSSDSTIILGEKGVAKATLTAKQVVIGGTVHGNIVAHDRLEILSTGRVHGDVQTASARLLVAEGVIFEGRVAMGTGRKAEAEAPAKGAPAPAGNSKQPRPSRPPESKAQPAAAGSTSG